MLAEAFKLPDYVREDAMARAREQQERWGCERGPRVGAPAPECARVLGAVGLVLGDEGAFTRCPNERLYDADVRRVCRYRKYMSEPSGSAALAHLEPAPPAVLFDALEAVLEGESIAHRLWKERMDRQREEAERGRGLSGFGMGVGKVKRHG